MTLILAACATCGAPLVPTFWGPRANLPGTIVCRDDNDPNDEDQGLHIAQWNPGDIVLDRTNFVWRRFELGWRTVPRTRGIQYSDADITFFLAPLVKLECIPEEVTRLGNVPGHVAWRLRNGAEMIR